MEIGYLIAGGILFIIAGVILGNVFHIKMVGQIKEENERLNNELRRLTDRDERGRFKGGK